MAELLLKLRCDNPDCNVRAGADLETTQDAIDAGWVFLRTADGEWEYCGLDCLRMHL